MPEVKRDLIELKEGVPYDPGPCDWVITEHHSIADILRYVVDVSDIDTVLYIVNQMKGESHGTTQERTNPKRLRA